jgi:hypothetical protein
LEHSSWNFEELVSGKGIEVETELHLLSFTLLNVKIFLQTVFIQLFRDFMEVLFVELCFFRDEDVLQYFIDFPEVPHLYHSIGLINDQVFEVLEGE